MRRLVLSLLPKILISRVTGWLTRIPLPKGIRGWAFGTFARRYGVDLDEIDRPLAEFRSLSDFFARPLSAGSRHSPSDANLVWPCDGRIVTCGSLVEEEQPEAVEPSVPRILQVKGVDYRLDELLGCTAEQAAAFAGGSQATIYLAPGDYHRVHAPFTGRLTSIRAIRGTLFPVNPPAVDSIPGLFCRNARRVFDFTLDDGRPGAVVMVGALNVGDITASAAAGDRLAIGQEIGRFGFGSTTVVVLARGATAYPTVDREARVLQGGAPN